MGDQVAALTRCLGQWPAPCNERNTQPLFVQKLFPSGVTDAVISEKEDDGVVEGATTDDTEAVEEVTEEVVEE